MALAKADNSPQVYNPAQLALFFAFLAAVPLPFSTPCPPSAAFNKNGGTFLPLALSCLMVNVR
jgi:hypothetical protein